MKKIKFALVIAVFGFGLVVSLSPVTNVFAGGGTRLECKMVGAGDTSMDARYEEKDGREKLSVSFEAAPGGDFQAGNMLTVKVGGALLPDKMTLIQPVTNGDIVGDIDFDSDEDDINAEDLPFPSITVRKGDLVVAGDLGCSLGE